MSRQSALSDWHCCSRFPLLPLSTWEALPSVYLCLSFFPPPTRRCRAQSAGVFGVPHTGPRHCLSATFPPRFFYLSFSIYLSLSPCPPSWSIEKLCFYVVLVCLFFLRAPLNTKYLLLLLSLVLLLLLLLLLSSPPNERVCACVLLLLLSRFPCFHDA